MRITSVNNYTQKKHPLSFGVNLQSKKLRFKNDDFFVKIKGYGTNSCWANVIKDTADQAVKYIRENFNFEWILRYITGGVREANQYTSETRKRVFTGILRTNREDWQSEDADEILLTPYGGIKSIYKSYRDRFDNTVLCPLKNPFDNFSLTRPEHDHDFGKQLIHPNSEYVNNSLNMVKDLYDEIHKKYIEKEATKADLNDINNYIAEIRWILAHSTPWKRGSDAISNTFIRSIYKAIGIKCYPLKKGVSLDLEAFCTNLSEYKRNFPDYFSKKPVIVD